MLEADEAHKTFFNHFPAKQDLVRALADESLEILLAEIDAARAAGRTTGQRLRVFFESVARRAAGAGPTPPRARPAAPSPAPPLAPPAAADAPTRPAARSRRSAPARNKETTHG